MSGLDLNELNEMEPISCSGERMPCSGKGALASLVSRRELLRKSREADSIRRLAFGKSARTNCDTEEGKERCGARQLRHVAEARHGVVDHDFDPTIGDFGHRAGHDRTLLDAFQRTADRVVGELLGMFIFMLLDFYKLALKGTRS